METVQPKFKTKYNAHLFKPTGETNEYVDKETGEVKKYPSKTLPNQSMSVREILDRYSKGLPITSGKVPVYHGEDFDMPEWDKLDLTEKQELREAAAEDIRRLKEELNEKAAKRMYKKQQQQFKKQQELENKQAGEISESKPETEK